MEQFEQGIDWSRSTIPLNFDICTVGAKVKKATVEKGRDTDPWEVLQGILVVGESPGSSNPDPISDQKCDFPHPF